MPSRSEPTNIRKRHCFNISTTLLLNVGRHGNSNIAGTFSVDHQYSYDIQSFIILQKYFLDVSIILCATWVDWIWKKGGKLLDQFT